MAHVQSGDTDRIPSGENSRRGDGLVEKDEGEHAVEHVAEVAAVLFVLKSEVSADVLYTLHHIA